MAPIIGMGMGTRQLVGMNPYGWIFQLLIFVAFFLVIYWITKGSKTNESAKEILNKKYLQKEISRKEFLKLKKDIE